MESLKNMIFSTIEKEIELKEFEQWLYRQEDLSFRMDEELILELYSFNYNQRGAGYEFNSRFIKYFDKEEFTNWKILTNLKMLGEGCKDPERILDDFKYLSEEGYSFLSHLGYAVYDLEECEYLGWDRPQLLEIIRDESIQLLKEIIDWLQEAPNNKLMDFKSKCQKSYITLPVKVAARPTNITQSKKWWKFWK